MGYGVNQWASQPGRAKAAGSSRGKTTRTAKRRTSASARRAKRSGSRKASKKKISIGIPSYATARRNGWGGDARSWQEWSADPAHRQEAKDYFHPDTQG